MTPKSIKLAGCAVGASCPSITLMGDKIQVTGTLLGDPDFEQTVVITREMFDEAAGKLSAIEKAKTEDVA